MLAARESVIPDAMVGCLYGSRWPARDRSRLDTDGLFSVAFSGTDLSSCSSEWPLWEPGSTIKAGWVAGGLCKNDMDVGRRFT